MNSPNSKHFQDNLSIFIVPSPRRFLAGGAHAHQDPHDSAQGRPGIPSAGRLCPQRRQHAAVLQHCPGAQGQQCPVSENAHVHRKLVGPHAGVRQPAVTEGAEPVPSAQWPVPRLRPAVRATRQEAAGHRRGCRPGGLPGRRAMRLRHGALLHSQEEPTHDGRVPPSHPWQGCEPP